MSFGKVSSLRPGYISGYEAVRRIAAVLSGTGIQKQEAGSGGFWFIAETDGKLFVQQDMLGEVKRLSFLRIGSDINPRLARKYEVVSSCAITQKIVPEAAIRRLEGLVPEKGCIMEIKHLPLEPVAVTPMNENKLSGLFLTVL